MVKLMKGKVLIFGANGFVGPYLSKEFTDNDYDVYTSDINEPEDSEYNFIKGDILNQEDVYKIINETAPNIIINLAAVSSVGMSWNVPQVTMDVNVIGSLNILEASRKQENSPKIMFIGSSEEYKASDEPINENSPLNSNNPYGISKMTQERFAHIYRERYGMQVYCVRPFNHTGIGQKDTFVLPSFCKQVAEIEKSGKPGTIKVGNLAVKRDFTDVRDIVRAYRMIIENGDCNKIYNIGSGKAYGLDELLEYIVSLSNQDIEIEIDPLRYRPVDTPVVCCDNSLIKNELNWNPEFSVSETLKSVFEHYL